MTTLLNMLAVDKLAPELGEADGRRTATELSQMTGLEIYPRSITAIPQGLYCMGRRDGVKYVARLSASAGGAIAGESRSVVIAGQEFSLTVGPISPANAVTLRSLLPFLVAKPLGLRKSGGTGDRLGLATPGHIRAFRTTFGTDGQSGMAPILTQQSIRENARTGRTPQEVMDDAVWGVLQEGWRHGFGADADHLKNTQDVDVCVAAGYTFFTVDPGEHVDDSANTAGAAQLQAKAAQLDWTLFESSVADLLARLAGKTIDLGTFAVTLSEEEVLRAAAKYGHAVSHTVRMQRHLQQAAAGRPWELEMSVDETETVTSLAEHIYIASELKRLAIRCVSLAPRYVGTFEKGVDYIGDLAAFERSIQEHMAVSHAFGPYKLSLHSGSDKFSVYPIAARVCGDLVHLKTAGTSYLEALRAIAVLRPELFREIVAFARGRYTADRASYHVSAELDKMPGIQGMVDDQLTELLDNFHAREILHVTFGSVLNHQPFREPFFSTLRHGEDTYTEILERHFNKHLAPFV